MQLAIATSIPVREWAEETNEMIATALDVLAEQAEARNR